MSLIDKIIDAGVVGAGGAGFPTHVKYSTQTEYFILNAAECEPLIHSDKFLIRTYAKNIVDTMMIVAGYLNASNVVIAIKNTYKKEIEILKEAIGSNNISIFEMNSFYPAGDEQVIVYEVTGRQVPIGKLPKDIGAVVSNVCTIYDVHNALNAKPSTSKILSVMGEVTTPSIIEVPIGMRISECLEKVGLNSPQFSVILGGPMMGRIYDSADIDDLTITKTTNSLIVLPENHYLLKNQNKPLRHSINQTNSACIQCRECTEMCPRFLIGHPLHPHKVMRNIAFGNIETNTVLEEALICCECGLCDFVCPMHLSPRRINQMVKKELAGKKTPKGDMKEAVVLRNYRKIPTHRLAYMLDVQKYMHQKPESTLTFNTDTVFINLKQHIGKESLPVVSVGDSVVKGALIAKIPDGALGANIHASIAGKVVDINPKCIVIRNK